MSSLFTPGPWMVPDRMQRVVSEGSWHTVAQCGNDGVAIWTITDPEVCDANARLIAAAPELLASLEEILMYGLPQPGAQERARAAIAKALPTNNTGGA